jgi:hypothetical protein
MITAYVAGDGPLLERLRALPRVVNSGLVRSITQLGKDLQRAKRPSSRADLRIEHSGTTITASVSLASYDAVRKDGETGTANVRASLRRKREAFLRPTAAQADGALAASDVMGRAEPSFLRSALDNMTSALRDEIDATLAQGLLQ